MTEDLPDTPEGDLVSLVKRVEEGDMTEEEVLGHMDQVSEQVQEFTDGTRTGNIVYAQSHVLEKASQLLREYYSEQDLKGEREAEAMATAIILESEAEEEVM